AARAGPRAPVSPGRAGAGASCAFVRGAREGAPGGAACAAEPPRLSETTASAIHPPAVSLTRGMPLIKHARRGSGKPRRGKIARPGWLLAVEDVVAHKAVPVSGF